MVINHLVVIRSPETKADLSELFLSQFVRRRRRCCRTFLTFSSSPESLGHAINFNQTWHNRFLGKVERSWHKLYTRGNYTEIVKILLTISKMNLFQNHG